MPTSYGSSKRCNPGQVTLSFTLGANSDGFRLYTVATGGTPISTVIGTATTYQLNATTTLYASGYNSISGCESATRLAVPLVISPPTVAVPSPVNVSRCGSGQVTLAFTASNNTFSVTTNVNPPPSVTGNIRLYTQATGGSPVITSPSITITSSPATTAQTFIVNLTTTTTYFADFDEPNNPGCTSTTRQQVATATVLPNLPTPTVANITQCTTALLLLLLLLLPFTLGAGSPVSNVVV
jgi:hypothetical protein